jgi:hypothetical protein
MNRIARYNSTLLKILLGSILVVALNGNSGCQNPLAPDPPAKRLHNGAVYNWEGRNYSLVLTNPPPEYSTGTNSDYNYSIPRRFDAMSNGYPGVQSYWLHEKSSVDIAYRFEVLSLEGNHVAYLDIRPDGGDNDAPDPVYSKSGLDWWIIFPSGSQMDAMYPDTTGGGR